MQHEFSRTEMLIGKEALKKLARSKVAVLGIGGVGSFAAEGLARSGIGRLVLVDNDCICRTNINRQIHAAGNTVGKPKVEVMKDRILAINPRAEVIARQTFYTPDCAAGLITPDLDYIIDAVDTVTAKIDIVVNARQKCIPVISCMGTGNKLDPTKFEIADIYDTSVCPLARVMRRELRKRGVKGLKVVYSREEPIKPGESEKPASIDSCANPCESGSTCARRQVPGSIAFVPSVAGLLMAGVVVRDLINKLQ